VTDFVLQHCVLVSQDYIRFPVYTSFIYFNITVLSATRFNYSAIRWSINCSCHTFAVLYVVVQ
jgi:hypothetical protein